MLRAPSSPLRAASTIATVRGPAAAVRHRAAGTCSGVPRSRPCWAQSNTAWTLQPGRGPDGRICRCQRANDPCSWAVLHAGADVFARVLGPQPPGPGLEGVPYGGGQCGLALGGGGEPGEHGQGEAVQSGVVVAQGELVEGPGPVGTGPGVPPQQRHGVVPAVRGEVAQYGEGEAGPALVGVDEVLGVEEVLLDRFEPAVEIQVEARVVQGAVLDVPVVAGVVEDAVVEGRERFGARRGERVQRAVAAAPLQEAEQGAARRYDWIEHGKSLTSSCRRNRDTCRA